MSEREKVGHTKTEIYDDLYMNLHFTVYIINLNKFVKEIFK